MGRKQHALISDIVKTAASHCLCEALQSSQIVLEAVGVRQLHVTMSDHVTDRDAFSAPHNVVVHCIWFERFSRFLHLQSAKLYYYSIVECCPIEVIV